VFLLNAMGKVSGRVTTSSSYHHCEVFFASAYGTEGSIHSPRVGDYEYPIGGRQIVQLAKKMAQTKQPPIDNKTMLEPMEIIEAARIAHQTGKRAPLKAVK
jgi:hypothetical protein